MAWPLIHCNHAIAKLQSEIQHLGVEKWQAIYFFLSRLLKFFGTKLWC